MLYPKKEQELSKDLFQNPTSEYRGTPFWAWNCEMNEENIDYSIEALEAMGMGGGHIHCRTGMAVEYMSDRFLELVEYANKKFTDKNMLTWLYDEDRWPSGYGGGFVTKNHEFRNRFLVFTPNNLDGKDITGGLCKSTAAAIRSNDRRLLASYAIKLENGYLADYKRIEKNTEIPNGYEQWFAYIEVGGDNPWFNNQAYVNTLDKNAIKKFIEVTHEKYYKKFGNQFGKNIPAIFTDEPQFTHKGKLGFAEDKTDIIIPFTDDFEQSFVEEYGTSILDELPELFWELGEDKYSLARYRYHDHLCERFAQGFADTLGQWCKEHGILLTGHMMAEDTLFSQTSALGEAMRSYRSFTLPGIDILSDRREFSTAKQAASASHQYGREGVTSELYGVTNWDFDFRGHKLQGDWQAAIGITVRVPHLTWVSMAGEAKRDYPASIGYQSPWYKEYPFVENYFARVNTAMTRGKADIKVGVIHPIESFWLYWGTDEKTGDIREEMDRNFKNLVNWLLSGLIDFDFISESLLPSLSNVEEINGNSLKVGAMNYDVIVVPNCLTMRKTTLERLEKFVQNGGKVIFTGTVPKLVDAVVSNKQGSLIQNSMVIPFNKSELLKALEGNRVIDIKNETGVRTSNLIYQLRNDNDDKWLFIAHMDKPSNPDVPVEQKLTLYIKGNYKPVIYDAVTGNIMECDYEHKNNQTILKYSMFDHDSLLLKLENSTKEKIMENKMQSSSKSVNILFNNVNEIELNEPNVCILDLAEYRFDDGQWQPREEVLRIDNKFRKELGYPLRMEAFAQPWVNAQKLAFDHKLSLKFTVESEIEITGAKLALEDAEKDIIYFNGEKIDNTPDGWYTDRSIKTVKLPKISKGSNEILVEIPYNSKVNVEAMYLLGDFSVEVKGSTIKLKSPVKEIGFGDITRQGLPFYGGNVKYIMEIETAEGELSIQIPQFKNPLIKVTIDGKEAGIVAYSPYVVKTLVSAGKHRMEFTAFGNRVNTFGTLHNCDKSVTWFGPNAWRTEGVRWSYEYQLRATGILVAPIIELK